jgi:hypothetical protein
MGHKTDGSQNHTQGQKRNTRKFLGKQGKGGKSRAGKAEAQNK